VAALHGRPLPELATIRHIDFEAQPARFFHMQDPDGDTVGIIQRGGRFR
jgi:hypothetical protein